MKTFTVTAKRWARGWELHIDGVGVTQARNLGEAEAMARDYIAIMTDVPADSFEVDIRPDIEPDLAAAAASAREAIREAERAQATAASRSRDVVKDLKAAGLSGVDVAAYIGVTPQRVSQLAPDQKRAARTGQYVPGGKSRRGASKRRVSA